MTSETSPPRASTPDPSRRRLRILPIIAGVGVAWLLSFWYAPKQVELLLVLPSEAVEAGTPEIQGLEIRVLRTSDEVQIARARRSRTSSGRTVVMPVRVPRGEYRVEAWSIGPPELERFEGTFHFGGDDVIEVQLSSSE